LFKNTFWIPSWIPKAISQRSITFIHEENSWLNSAAFTLSNQFQKRVRHRYFVGAKSFFWISSKLILLGLTLEVSSSRPNLQWLLLSFEVEIQPMLMRDQNLYKSPAIEVLVTADYHNPDWACLCWYFCNAGLKNCWHWQLGLNPQP